MKKEKRKPRKRRPGENYEYLLMYSNILAEVHRNLDKDLRFLIKESRSKKK